MIRVTYILYEGNTKHEFGSEVEARQFWRSNRLSSFPAKDLIRVETNVELLQKAVEENRKNGEGIRPSRSDYQG